MTDSNEPNPLAERIAESVTLDEGSSRRTFLSRSVLAGGALLALGGGTGLSLAQEDDAESEDGETATFDDVDGTDVDVLNYALSLERLEDAFYDEVLDEFDEDDFADADALEAYDEEMRREVYGQVKTVGEHEAAHVDVLTQAVELLGGEPAPEQSYTFDVESVGDVLALGQVLENTGVAAYAGAAPYVESPDLLGAALSIHSAEARHAAFFNKLVGMSPFPNAFDPASSQEDVLDAVGQFIESEEADAAEASDEETEDGEEPETPANETVTETPANETMTETPANETMNETPANETATGNETS